MTSVRQRLSENLFNIRGWRTNRKIIVIESDDWGSIRMPSKEVYEDCLEHGYRLDNTVFSRYDSLASEEDLTLLFELLLSFKDWKSNHPVVTANCLMANPDFERIQNSNFEKYYYELVTDTFNKYPKHKNCFNLWQQGEKLNIFKPQSHGREHLNVSRFMNELRAGDPDSHFAFRHQMPNILKKSSESIVNSSIIALEHYDAADKSDKELIVKDGLLLFRKLFGYSSESFIASNYVWHKDLETVLKAEKVLFIQGSKKQYIPKGKYRGFTYKFHFLGEMNSMKQIYLIRNVLFEPALNMTHDHISSSLRQIETAFAWHKPAIISMHRVNFIGFINEKIRDRTLKLLQQLLRVILRRWPDVEFLSTAELGNLILEEQS